MSPLNLLPWREREQQLVMRRWRWGACWTLVLIPVAVYGMDHALQVWHAQHDLQRQQWAQEQQRLTHTLSEARLWQTRWQQAQQVNKDAVLWQFQQQQAWRALTHVFSLPPSGVQIEHLQWQDQQLHVKGWAISSSHVQRWQEALQAQRPVFHEAQWRQTDGLACRQHAFELTSPSPWLGAGS